MNLDHTKVLLRERLGLCFEGHSEDRLRRVVGEQMSALGIPTAAAYLARLRTDEAAWQALVGLVTVKETYFLREPHHLDLLVERLLPELLRERAPGTPIRLLSAGCATGEEPYSIAIALRERWGEEADRLFRIQACDVDRDALEQARLGRYRTRAFRAMSRELIERWFGPLQDGVRSIAESIRRAVAFSPLSLLSDRYPPELAGQDLIFYRNLSIYFDLESRRAAMARLRGLLRPGGYLIVGTSEILANDFGDLSLCERNGVWLFADRPPGPAPSLASPRPALPAQPRTASPSPQARPATPSPSPSPSERKDRIYRQALALARAEQVDSALECLAPLWAETDASPESLTLQAHLLLERDDREGAQAAIERALRVDPWATDALVLLGRIAHARGALDQAVDALRRAVYQSPERWPAHYRLADCYRAKDQADLAAREYRIALRLLAQPEAATQAGPLPSPLGLQDLRRLCEARLAGLQGAS